MVLFKWLKKSGEKGIKEKELKDLYYLCFAGSGVELDKKLLLSKIRRHYKILTVLIDAKIVGFAFLNFYPNWIHLDYLGIHPSYQSFGLGKKILAYVKTLDKPVILECVDKLIGYYQKNDFSLLRRYNSYIYHGHKLNILIHCCKKYSISFNYQVYRKLLEQCIIFVKYCDVYINNYQRYDINIIKLKPIFFKLINDFFV